MAQFENYEGGIVWTNGDIGAYLQDCESLWQPFTYFSNGNLDISEKKFGTAAKAFEAAIDIFS